MNKNGILTSMWPLGEGAAKPGIEWPEGTQPTLADHNSLADADIINNGESVQ